MISFINFLIGTIHREDVQLNNYLLEFAFDPTQAGFEVSGKIQNFLTSFKHKSHTITPLIPLISELISRINPNQARTQRFRPSENHNPTRSNYRNRAKGETTNRGKEREESRENQITNRRCREEVRHLERNVSA